MACLAAQLAVFQPDFAPQTGIEHNPRFASGRVPDAWDLTPGIVLRWRIVMCQTR
jgi:hypothetical protein